MASAATLSTSLLLLLQLLPSYMVSKLSDFKMCGDPECTRFLNRVTATLDYTGQDCRFLTFKHGDSIFVYLKLTGKRDDLWAGSIEKRFGYFPKDAVKVEDVITSTEVELPTQESDFLCLDEENYHIDNEEKDSVIDEYEENSFSMPAERKATLGHEPKPNKYNQVYEGNSAKTEPVDNLINLYKKQVQEIHHNKKLEMNSGKDQLQKSLALDENMQINEFLSPADHQNQLNDESVSRHTDNTEFNLFTLPESVHNEYIGTENNEHPGQEISEDIPITMESYEVSKFVQEESNWIGTRISGWFGLESNKDEKVLESTDQPMQLNSFKSRKIPLDYLEDTVLSEEGNKNMYYDDKGIPGSEMSGWIGGLSKLLNFNSDSSEDGLSTNEGEKNKHENTKSFLADDSTDPSKTLVTKSGNKMSERSVADDSRLKDSQSENIDKDKQNLISSVQSLFGLGDKLWFGQDNKPKNPDISEESKVTREESRNDIDKSESWWLNLNPVSNIFRLAGDNGGQTFRTSEETQNVDGNAGNSRDTDGSNSQWSHFSLSEMLGFSQGNEDQVSSLPDETKETIIENSKETTLDVDRSKSQRVTFGLKNIFMFDQTNEDHLTSKPLEETKKSTISDKKENTMNSKSEESYSILKSFTSRVASIADSLINEDTIHSPKQCLTMMGNDVACQSEHLQQSEKEYRKTKSESAQSTFSINGLENSFQIKTSKLQGVQELLEKNLIPDSDFMGPNKPLTQESLHEDQSLQGNLIDTSEIKQRISDYTKTEPYGNVYSGEKFHGEQKVLQNQDLTSKVEQITIMSKHDPLALESLSEEEEEQYLTMHSEWALNKDPGSETTLPTEADNADHSAWDKLQAEGELLQENLESKLKSEQLISNATNSKPVNNLQNVEKFSQQVINSDLQQIPITDNDQHLLEERLHHKQQQEGVASAFKFEQLDASGNNKLLSQIQTYNEQQNFSSEFNDQVVPSSQNELNNEEAFKQVTRLTSANEQTSDHYNLLSEKEKKQEEMSQLNNDDKVVIATNINEPSLERQLYDETCQVQSLQQVSDHIRDLSKEKLHANRNVLQHQTLTLDSESNQHTSDRRECSHVEEPDMKECQLFKSASNELASDAENPFSLKMHDEQNLQVKQATSNAEPKWLATFGQGEAALSEHLQTNVLIHTGSNKGKFLVKEKLNDKDCVLQKQCIMSDLKSGLHAITEQDKIHNEEQTLPYLLSYSQPEEHIVSYNDKTLNQENSSYQQKSIEDKRIYLESETQFVDLDSTVDLSEEETTAPIISITITNTEKSNEVQSSLEEPLNSLPSVDANPPKVHSSKHQDTDTKVKPQHVVKETNYEIDEDYAKTGKMSNGGTTQLSTESASVNLQKDETQSNSEKLIVTYAHEMKETSKLSAQVNVSSDANNENIHGAEAGAEEELPTSKDTFSSDDTLDTRVASEEQISEILEKAVQTNKHVQEQKGTKDIISEIMEREVLETLTLKVSDSITELEKMTVEAEVENKLGNQLQKETQDARNEESSYYQTEEKTMLSRLSEVEKPSVTDDPRVGTPTDNDIEYERIAKETAGHKPGSVFDFDLQNFMIIVDNFIQNSFQTVMDTLSEDLGASSNLHGPCTELFLISFLLGIITALLFIYRTCQAVKSRRYMGREKQLAETVSQLFDEKCKVLETLSSCKEKYSEFEASVKDVAGLKQSTETKTLHLQDTYAKLDNSNDTLRQAIDQFTQDLEGEKQTRSQQSNLITEIQANLSALENEAQNLKIQVEEAKKEFREIQINDARHQESFQAAKEENYHLKQSKEQLLQESEGWHERYNELTEHIKLGTKSQKDIREVLACKENEVKCLTDCLLKMKLWNLAEEDNPAEEISEERQKQKIEKLIYVAKLNASLKSVEEERNQIHSKLSDETKAKQELMERIEKLKLEHTSVQCVKTQFETEYKTIQQKLKIMTELYHEKEMELQRNLTLEEHQRLQKEEKLSEVDEKINQATEELTIYRQRAKDLEEELIKTMQSYKNQIVSHEKKGHDNWLSAREAERELGNIKRENVHLRQKITEAEFKMDIALKDPLVIEVSGRPALSASTFVPPYRGRTSPYGPSPVGRPGSEPVGFLSPPLLDGPLRFSPLFPGKPDSKTRGPSVQLDHTTNENTDSVSDRISDQHGPQSDSGSLSPVWERERKLFRTSPALICVDGHPKLENSMQASNSASVSQVQDHDTFNISLNQSLPVEAEFGIRPSFAPSYRNQVPSLPFDLRGHGPLRGLPLPPHGGIYGPPERFPLRAFGLPPHPSMGIRDPIRLGPFLSNVPPPRPIFLPNRPLSDIAGGLLPSRLPLPKFPSTEHPPSSQEK